MGGVGAERARVVRPVTERGEGGGDAHVARGGGDVGARDDRDEGDAALAPDEHGARGWGSAPEREPPTVATVASNSGAGTMPCTRAAPNTVAESAGVSPPPPRGSYKLQARAGSRQERVARGARALGIADRKAAAVAKGARTER